MGFIAPRLDVIKPSPSMAVTARAIDMRAAGIDVISLSAGEPDFPTPAHVVEAAYAAMRRGETRYTAVDGTVALKKAVADKFRRENGLDYRPSEITVAGGAKQIIYNALLATLAPGDEVIVPAPYWVSYTDIVLLGEGKPVVVPCGEELGFKLTPSALRAAITGRTKWLLINTPSNPTGAVYGRDELAALAAVLLDHPHVHVLTDDIYEHILFDGRAFHTIASVEPRLKERTLTVNGVSKAYAMTGWRIGYAGGPEPLIRAMATVQSQSTSNPSSISQAATIAALDGPQDFLAPRALEFQARRDRALELLRAIPGLSCRTPEGAFYLYPDCSALIGRRRPDGSVVGSDDDLSLYLLDHARVAVVQGSAYGLSPHFCISIATSMDLIEKAIGRIAEAVEALR
ncbi:pyridoxal phosphate-dependent aminotransferase [Mesorhizobium sp. M2C.T.Ca.TU.002.02.1.1]|uniref:pyridoxal phosphate-dependent aminotransferase n=1 Tax=Mesorhizobium sp. M2C.T.Ca.TU.002.02.1.1 TaxID=2496788 RepID=UPI000FCB72BA|nr:pyridoxal phosphate-dependent aminotransferase [Mesorhizobium sp. M2C.T.Ca.TU.002.02.1.1]RUU57623.1 pyridoxal phosphate-dependent aminotransferase [Mesorhizobium sp. M2C.T.Ca.TU.002.02.1.1]